MRPERRGGGGAAGRLLTHSFFTAGGGPMPSTEALNIFIFRTSSLHKKHRDREEVSRRRSIGGRRVEEEF